LLALRGKPGRAASPMSIALSTKSRMMPCWSHNFDTTSADRLAILEDRSSRAQEAPVARRLIALLAPRRLWEIRTVEQVFREASRLLHIAKPIERSDSQVKCHALEAPRRPQSLSAL